MDWWGGWTSFVLLRMVPSTTLALGTSCGGGCKWRSRLYSAVGRLYERGDIVYCTVVLFWNEVRWMQYLTRTFSVQHLSFALCPILSTFKLYLGDLDFFLRKINWTLLCAYGWAHTDTGICIWTFFRPNTFWNHTTGHVLTPSHAKAIELRQVTVQSYTQTTSTWSESFWAWSSVSTRLLFT